MQSPFRLQFMVGLIVLTFPLTACSSSSEQAVEHPTVQTAPTSLNLDALDLDEVRDVRLRLEQKLVDYEKQLEQIWQSVAETSS